MAQGQTSQSRPHRHRGQNHAGVTCPGRIDPDDEDPLVHDISQDRDPDDGGPVFPFRRHRHAPHTQHDVEGQTGEWET